MFLHLYPPETGRQYYLFFFYFFIEKLKRKATEILLNISIYIILASRQCQNKTANYSKRLF